MRPTRQFIGAILAYLAGQPVAVAQETTVIRGTPFRGIALGDDRATLDAALAQLKLRCMTADERAVFDLPAEKFLPEGTGLCRIVGQDAQLAYYSSDALQYLANIGQLEFSTMSAVYAVTLRNGRVVEMHLQPEFFGAAGVDARTFASAIVENYRLPNGLAPMASGGWQGMTTDGDLVRIYVSPNGTKIVLVVTRPDDRTTPTFD